MIIVIFFFFFKSTEQGHENLSCFSPITFNIGRTNPDQFFIALDAEGKIS